MATFRKRNGLWQVQVRSIHAGSTSKSFRKNSDAERWAKIQETLMQTGDGGEDQTKFLYAERYDVAVFE